MAPDALCGGNRSANLDPMAQENKHAAKTAVITCSETEPNLSLRQVFFAGERVTLRSWPQHAREKNNASHWSEHEDETV